MIAPIRSALEQCAARPAEPVLVDVRDHRPPRSRVQEFVVVLKPELHRLAAGVAVEDVLNLVLGMLAEHEVEVCGVRALSGSHLARHRLVQQQYPLLNEVSRRGLAALPRSVRRRVAAEFPDVRKDRVLGGHEFLAAVDGFSPYALDVLTRNSRVVKLGANAYAIRVSLDDRPWLLLNPFHPAQLLHLTTPGHAVVVLSATSRRPIAEVRAKAIGTTDPSDALPGSIKHALLSAEKDLGIAPVCTRLNGIHMSPGLVEGMFGVARYFGRPNAPLPLSDTAFGAALLAAGHDLRAVYRLADNPDVQAAGGPLFEVTEDLDFASAFDLVGAVLRR